MPGRTTTKNGAKTCPCNKLERLSSLQADPREKHVTAVQKQPDTPAGLAPPVSLHRAGLQRDAGIACWSARCCVFGRGAARAGVTRDKNNNFIFLG